MIDVVFSIQPNTFPHNRRVWPQTLLWCAMMVRRRINLHLGDMTLIAANAIIFGLRAARGSYYYCLWFESTFL